MKPWVRQLVFGALAALLALILASCALPVVSGIIPSPRTLAQAKADTQRTLEEIFAYIPHDTIETDYGATETMRYLLPCSQPGTYTWPAAHSAKLKPSTDGKQILDRIATDWAHKPGWRMVDERDDPQMPLITLYAADGQNVIVYFDASSPLLDISSGSACVYVDHYDGLKEY